MEEERVNVEDLDLKAKEKRLVIFFFFFFFFFSYVLQGKFLSRWFVSFFGYGTFVQLFFAGSFKKRRAHLMKRFFLKPEKMIEEANMSLSLPLKYLPFRLGEREQNMATFGNNRLTTYKYTVLTFLPKVLFEQFHKVRILFESEDFFCSQFFFFFFFFFPFPKNRPRTFTFWFSRS
jgi:hypothetical protein